MRFDLVVICMWLFAEHLWLFLAWNLCNCSIPATIKGTCHDVTQFPVTLYELKHYSSLGTFRTERCRCVWNICPHICSTISATWQVLLGSDHGLDGHLVASSSIHWTHRPCLWPAAMEINLFLLDLRRKLKLVRFGLYPRSHRWWDGVEI